MEDYAVTKGTFSTCLLIQFAVLLVFIVGRVCGLTRWCKQFDDAKNENEDSNLFRGSGNFSSDEAKELARLKKENRDLKDAVEILKKAMSIISSQ